MAKKSKAQKPQHEVTRRQLSYWQQQQKRQRIIRIAAIILMAAVLIIVGGGWYLNQYRPLHQIAIRVYDTKFNMDYYIRMLKIYREVVSPEYYYSLADDVATIIERNEMIRLGAMKLGITVSDEVVDEELKNQALPVTKEYRDLVRSGLLVTKMRDEYFASQVPTSAAQRDIMAMLLESKSQASEVRARLEKGDDFGKLAGELSLESVSRSDNGSLGWHSQEVLDIMLNTSVPGDYAFQSEAGALSQPTYDETVIKQVGYWLVEVLDTHKEAEEVRVQSILLGNEEEANMVRGRLIAGDNFTALAKEFSQNYNEDTEADMGWLTKDNISSPTFSEFVFNAEIGALSEPIRDDQVTTKSGYWLIRILDKEDDREISDNDRSLLTNDALNKWGTALWVDANENTDMSYLDDEKKAWAMEQIAVSTSQQQ